MTDRLEGVEIIISSPYTRAMQSATIISKNRKLDIRVEIGLHEWETIRIIKYVMLV